jgi:hypothetical protein
LSLTMVGLKQRISSNIRATNRQCSDCPEIL